MKNRSKNPVKVQADIHREILEKCKLGDTKAQYQLYQLYARAMFNICYRMLNSREEAEDMLQEAFTDAFHRLHTFRYESGFGSWIKRIIVNKCINEIKRKKAKLEFFEDMGSFENEEVAEDYETGLSVENVKKAMQHLPDGSRVIFSLYLLEGYDHREISQILNTTESNSKSQYMRAKRKVKQVINEMQLQNG